MPELPIEIPTADGLVDGLLSTPDGEGPWPGLLFLTDIGGVRAATASMARRISDQGYVVLLPNLFYRTMRPPVFDFPDGFRDPRAMPRMAELTAPLTPEAIGRDAASYADFLSGRPEVRPGPLGVVGHCFSGGVALRMAATLPDVFAAMASFHGGRLYTDAPTSPHLVLPAVRARLYFAHADQDGSMPAEAIAGLKAVLSAWGGQYESELYAGARHGWTTPGGPVHDEVAANRAFDALISLLRETIG